MSVAAFASVIRHALRLVVPLAVASTVYLYLYPVFHGCAFPLPGVNDAKTAFVETARLRWPAAVAVISPANATAPPIAPAPFRLLALGDPQLEGDTSIPNARWARSFPHWDSLVDRVLLRTEHRSLRDRIRASLHDAVDLLLGDVPDTLLSLRKRLDLFGNDFYLAHVYRTMRWWSSPSHVAVLGDLLGSQWVNDAEFEARGRRFWNRVFRGANRVPDDIALFPADEYELAGYLGPIPPGTPNATREDRRVQEAWANRIINVAGNHDIGYAGDLTKARLERFERVFGKANYELRFEISLADKATIATLHDPETNPESDRLPPELRIVVVNNMNLDTPALDSELQDATYNFVNEVIRTASAVEFQGHFTVVLAHVPLHKPAGICTDEPYFSFHDDSVGGVKEQNFLSEATSLGFLEGIFGLSGDTMAPGNGRGRRGVLLNGHDHNGCDTFHFVNQSEGANSTPEQRPWRVKTWEEATREGAVGAPGIQGLREITVRSMMGESGGNAGLLSVWFDQNEWEFKFAYAECRLGKQHLWWAVHVVDLVSLVGMAVYSLLWLVGLTKATAAKPVPAVEPVANGQAASQIPAKQKIVKTELVDEDSGDEDEDEDESDVRSLRESTVDSVASSRRSLRESTVESKASHGRRTPRVDSAYSSFSSVRKR